MAEDLDQMLEPGERVLYRDPRYWVPHRWALFAFLAILWFLVSKVFNLSGGVFFVSYMVLLWVSYEFGGGGTETLLTERRILHKPRSKSSAKVILPLEFVTKVEVWPSEYVNSVKVTKTDGRSVDLFELHRPQPFALALAKAAGVARPSLIGPLIHILPRRLILFGLPSGSFAVLEAIDLSQPYLSHGFWEDPALWSIAAVAVLAAGLLGGLFGLLLGELAGYAFLRPVVTFDQARTAVCLMSEAEYEAVYGRRLGRLLEQIFFRWVGLLYGQTIHRENGMGAGHG